MDSSQVRSPSPPPGPLPIRRLEEALINRIAAGEIIHRPSSALKELLENALDAGATSIKITVKDGGMKLLQIQDNGSGIRKIDLPLLATRFATSKLTEFSDLLKLQTYGFRGEALASISHVAHLSVVTKTKSDPCAWKAYYSDGMLAPSKPGLSADPKACAGNDGTTLTVENLFYNTPTRLAALRSTSDEYSRILDVVTRYAVHNPSVAFMCKKAGSSSADLTTPQGSTVAQTIGLLYGSSIQKELIKVSVHPIPTASTNHEADDTEVSYSWSASAHITSPSYQARKFVFLLFINHRLVESARIKRALEAAYTGVLPRGTCPFVYLSILLPPHTVDVNVHPTKREVHFLDEDAITEKIADVVQAELVKRQGARSFEYQTLLTDHSEKQPQPFHTKQNGKGKEKARDQDEDLDAEEMEVEAADEDIDMNASTTVSKVKKTLSQHKVRTSTKDRTLDEMFPSVPSRTSSSQSHGDKSRGAVTTIQSPAEGGTPTAFAKDKPIQEAECSFTSITQLREEVKKSRHNELTSIIRDSVFVGIVDLWSCLSLIQHGKKLYLINHAVLAEELFYQLALRQFGNMKPLKLNPPPSIKTLIRIAMDVEDTSSSSMTKDQLVEMVHNVILSRRELLKEYFNLDISETGLINSIPLLLRRYTPNLDRLPLFLMRLGPQVDWNDETRCFQSIMRELAYLHVPGPLPINGETTESGDNEATEAEKAERWQIQHILLPAMRRYLIAPKRILDADITQVASLPDLYRVFERC